MTYEERIIHTTDFATPEERRQRDAAATYRPDPILERLYRLGAKAEAGNVVAATELATLAPSIRMALGYYTADRSAAVALGLASGDGQLTDKATTR